MERRLLRHGKYRDRSFGQVENEDRDYCAWVLRALDLPSSLRLFACYLKNRHGGIMTVGRNKGKYFDEVYLLDPGYCVWVMALATEASGNLRELQSYLGARSAFTDRFDDDDDLPRSRSPPQRRVTVHRAQADQAHDNQPLTLPDECPICCSRPIRTAFASCGHMVCCVHCSAKCDKCPICRVPVNGGDVIRLFGC